MVKRFEVKLDVKEHPVTFTFLAVSFVAFLISIFGIVDTWYLQSDAIYIVYRSQWYRVISSLLVHNQLGHLCIDLICIGAAGTYMETRLGHWRILLVMLATGIGGNLVSLLYRFSEAPGQVTVGCSCIAFGLLGLSYMYVRKHKGDSVESDDVIKYVIYLIVFLLFFSGQEHIDIVGNISGFAIGICLGLIDDMIKDGAVGTA